MSYLEELVDEVYSAIYISKERKNQLISGFANARNEIPDATFIEKSAGDIDLLVREIDERVAKLGELIDAICCVGKYNDQSARDIIYKVSQFDAVYQSQQSIIKHHDEALKNYADDSHKRVKWAISQMIYYRKIIDALRECHMRGDHGGTGCCVDKFKDEILAKSFNPAGLHEFMEGAAKYE